MKQHKRKINKQKKEPDKEEKKLSRIKRLRKKEGRYRLPENGAEWFWVTAKSGDECKNRNTKEETYLYDFLF